ncbi:unnamed protein product, partial [Rotaria sp. Silwood1]
MELFETPNTQTTTITSTTKNDSDISLQQQFLDVPQYLCCPISGTLMIDPVMAEDGHTYERRMIETWLRTDHDSRSPITREQINIENLTINYTIKQLVNKENAKRLPTTRLRPLHLNLLEMRQNTMIGIGLIKKIDRLKKLSTIFCKKTLEFSLMNSINQSSAFTTYWISEAERTFRDSTNYLIDGDSLVLTAASHCNVNWNNYGHTIHCIYYAERLLHILYKKTNKLNNYTIVFFDNHMDFLRKSPLLSAVRQCFITHFTKNLLPSMKIVRVFNSWLSNEYIAYLYEQKPLFIFYNDMNRLKANQLPSIDKENLFDLHALYRLFGDFHQNIFQCSLYLMNKIEFNNASISCFQL